MIVLRAIARRRNFIVKLVNLCLVAGIVLGYAGWSAKAAASDAAVEAKIKEAQHASTKGPYATDGTFTGAAQGYGGEVTMQVTVKNGYIEDVQVVSAPGEDAAYLSRAKALIPNIVDAQTPKVDAVSGATYSSTGIRNGVAAALQKSMDGQGAAS